MDEVVCVVPHNDFRDDLTHNTSVTSNEGLLLRTLTLQSRDATINNLSCAYPVALEHKNKSNMMRNKVTSMSLTK